MCPGGNDSRAIAIDVELEICIDVGMYEISLFSSSMSSARELPPCSETSPFKKIWAAAVFGTRIFFEYYKVSTQLLPSLSSRTEHHSAPNCV